ncbi:mannose-1-phosphate guanylyltransferase [Nannocystis pusilla]|uniref:mannose-1-phosphate guanylyltransferase n=1 Tax=Nannocystis pusilla TaxID=889268 RepID=UPI003BF35883
MRIALVMAGGGGSRLWPASTPERPKQFMALRDDRRQSLLAAAVDRAAAVAGADCTFLVTTHGLAAAVRAAAPQLAPEQVIEEPCPRSTAPCVALSLVHIVERLRARGWSERQIDETALMVLPSDHHIGDEGRFADLLARACDCAAETRDVVVLGVTPTRPETGYGYIERDGLPRSSPGDTACAALNLYSAVRFVEKPNLARAREFLASGRFLWNAGVCITPIGRLLAEYQRHAPALWQAFAPVVAALREGEAELARTRTAAAYAAIQPASIDVAILEQLADLRVAASDVAWTDLGSWAAIREALPRDGDGFAVHAENGAAVHVVDGRDGLVWTDGADVAIVGLDGVAVISSGGRILVCPLERAQEVRAAAEASARHAARPRDKPGEV